MTPDLPTDEVRRQLRAAQRAQATSLPLFRRALRRAFDPTSATPARDKAEVLGVSRRAVLSGGAVLGAGAVLAACGSGATEQIPVTGSIPQQPDTPTTTVPGSPDEDVVLLRTAQSIELLAVDVYDQALDSGLLQASAAIDTVELFQEQHREHADAIGDTLRGLGASVVTEPNQYVMENQVATLLEGLDDEETVLRAALGVENIAAATYVRATPTLTTPELRQAAMSIGGVEARHIALLHIQLEMVPVPTQLFRTGNAPSEQAYVE